MSENKVGLIYEIMPKIMAAIAPISKDSTNTQQGYKFRGIDAVYNFIQPILAEHGLFVKVELFDVQRSERPSKSGGVMTFVQLRARYNLVAPDGSSVCGDALGEGMDSGDKAVPKAMSVAQKYFFLQTFCIPTEDPKDVENDDPQPAAKTAKPAAQPPVEQKKPETPATEAQVKEIKEAAAYLMDLIKKTEAEIFTTLQLKVKKQFARDIAAIDELTESQATWIIKNLWKAIQSEGQKKIDEVANKVKGANAAPPNDGAPGGPSDPGEGAALAKYLGAKP